MDSGTQESQENHARCAVNLMDNKAEDTSLHDDRLAEALETYLAARDSGTPLSRTGFLREHEELADDLAECLDSLDFIEQTTGLLPATGALKQGDLFGEYEILREIARGGMGVVYEAFHVGLERRVALKVLSARRFDDERYREMFLSEAKTAAGLHHTNIVPVFEVGALDDVFYYAMQYIEGHSLGQLLRYHRAKKSSNGDDPVKAMFTSSAAEMEQNANNPRWATLLRGIEDVNYYRELADLMADVAESLHHAHCRGIVHRDIKPSNIVVDRAGRPWITDFGLAFRPEDTGDSSEDPVGTPLYMSPEQAEPGSYPIEYATDIYSLGASLYELLTRRPLFEAKSSLGLLRMIAKEEPIPAGQHNPRIPSDLEAIVHKAISKVPAERYATAADMERDLRAFTGHYPVQARNSGLVGRFAKWTRREPILATVSLAAILILTTVMTISHLVILGERNTAIAARNQARTERKQAQVERDRAQRFGNEARQSHGDALYQTARATLLSLDAGRRSKALESILEARAIKIQPEWQLALRNEAIAALSTTDTRLDRELKSRDGVSLVSFCPDGANLVAIGFDGISIWPMDDLEQQGPIQLTSGQDVSASSVTAMAISQCSRFLATSSQPGMIEIWDTRERVFLSTIDVGNGRSLEFLGFLGDPSRLVAVDRNGHCTQWDIDQAEPLKKFELGRSLKIVAGPGIDEITMLLREDRGRDQDGAGIVRVTNVVTDQSREFAIDPLARRGWEYAMSWNPKGTQLALAVKQGVVEIWDATAKMRVLSLGGHRDQVNALAYSPNGRILATGGYREPTVKLWDVSNGDLLGELDHPNHRAVGTLAFSPDGSHLGSGGIREKSVLLWKVDTPNFLEQYGGATDVLSKVQISADGRYIAAYQDESTLR